MGGLKVRRVNWRRLLKAVLEQVKKGDSPDVHPVAAANGREQNPQVSPNTQITNESLFAKWEDTKRRQVHFFTCYNSIPI